MNWFKKIIISNNLRTFTAREFLKALNDNNVIMERRGKGSRSMLLNLNNNKRTSFHFHNLGHMLEFNAVKSMLKDLGIDYYQFMDGEKVKNKEEIEQEVVPNWQNQSWFKNYINPKIETNKTAQNLFPKELWQLTEKEFNNKYLGKWKPGILTEEGEFMDSLKKTHSFRGG